MSAQQRMHQPLGDAGRVDGDGHGGDQQRVDLDPAAGRRRWRGPGRSRRGTGCRCGRPRPAPPRSARRAAAELAGVAGRDEDVGAEGAERLSHGANPSSARAAAGAAGEAERAARPGPGWSAGGADGACGVTVPPPTMTGADAGGHVPGVDDGARRARRGGPLAGGTPPSCRCAMAASYWAFASGGLRGRGGVRAASSRACSVLCCRAAGPANQPDGGQAARADECGEGGDAETGASRRRGVRVMPASVRERRQRHVKGTSSLRHGDPALRS